MKNEREEIKKAYTELNEIIKNMSTYEKEKIPYIIVQNLQENMDKNYKFIYDNQKSILEQNLKVETKALLVKIYEKYLASEDEKEFWKKYDNICHSIIEKEKRAKYDSNRIFENKTKEVNVIKNDEIKELPVCIKKENILKKIIKKIFYIN